jgi:hypothetical protein
MAQPQVAVQQLTEVTSREVERYIGYSPQERYFPLLDTEHSTFAVVGIPNWPRTYPAGIVVLARVVGDKIVIEEDTTDQPLYEALMANAGVPREQIILAYAGETLPETDAT